MKALLEKIRKLLKDKRFRKTWYRFVSGFAAVVVFITTYALVLPAITLEKTAACGIEEHQHDESCYETRLVCGREESEGHHHDDSCYTVTQELDCSLEEHQHSSENGCYDGEGNLICEIPEHTHDSSCYKDVETLTCGQEESEGHHHTDACYEEVLVCGKEAHIHNTECYKEDSSAVAATDEAAGGASTVTSGESDSASSNAMPEETMEDGTAGMTEQTAVSDPSVPQLDPVNLDIMLTKDTGFYYFHAEGDEEIPANSAEIKEWKKVEKDTKLISTDLVKAYLSYKIPAGSLNESNPVARYRLPENLHLTDEQIEAINKTENGVYTSMDQETDALRYLGAEAVEGDRKPDEELVDGVQEYISAVVRAENVFDEEGQYLGQDLIFTFVPYTIEKNQNTYDADGSQLTAGEKITGWFACDFNMSQIDWVEEETDPASKAAEDTSGEPEKAEESGKSEELEKTEDSEEPDKLEESDKAEESEEPGESERLEESEKSAEVVFVEEDREIGTEEISTVLKLVETKQTDKDTADTEETETVEYKPGTLTADGDGYKITLDYTEEAKIPENAELSVKEITPETDQEAYEACLEQAKKQVTGEDKYSVDQTASRFFDIEIVVRSTGDDESESFRKIEPAAPVSVNIQLFDESKPADPASGTEKNEQKDPTVLHFAKEGVEQIDSTVRESQAEENGEEQNTQHTEVEFEAESFSIYGVVYTVDFYWEVDGKIYTYSIPGGTAVNLKELLPLIGVISDNPDTEINELDKFEKEIADVRFSDETLVKVAHPEKDITLKELKEELGIDTILSAAYAIDENSDSEDTIPSEDSALMEDGAYFIDESAGDTDGLSFSAPETEPEEAEEVSEDELTEGETEEDKEDAQTEDSDAQTDQTDVKAITILKDEDTIAAGTWVLISVQPFTSDETLTVSMEDGEVFTVKVTDEQGIAWDVWFDGTLGQGGSSNRFYNGANNIHTLVSKRPSAMTGPNTIRMPAVGERVNGSDGNASVSAPNATGYSYRLNGWYDIRKGIMYQPGEVVTITQDTVFYADWVPFSYSKGPGAGTINTPSTAGFVKTELFDYNELINTNVVNVNVSVGRDPWSNQWTHSDIWTVPGNNDKYFNFISWNYNGNPSNSIGMPGNLQEASQYRYDTLTKDIYANNQGFIERIFNPQEEMIGKTYVGTGDYLFNYNPTTGEYYYDSDKNGATYNQGNSRFYVYQNKEYIQDNDGNPMTNFLPFNDQPGNYNTAPQQNTGRTDYWFGMKNTIDFYLHDDVDLSNGHGNKNPVSGEDMIFKFSGDDDVWVFVEDETGNRYQVLDLGGIHNRAGGFINFSTGEVTTFKGTIDNRENVVVDPVATAALQNVKSGNCRLTVYYLERGSSLSNCSIYFNLIPQPKTLELSKRLEGLTDEERAKYTDEEFTYELIVNGEPYDSNPDGVRDPDDDRYYAVYYDKDGHEIKEMVGGVEVVKKRRIIDGQITIKDGETVKIPRLDRFDTFYVAEEKGLNMNQFEIPHAERIYTDVNSAHHEEDVTLHRDHSTVADVDDWATPRYELQDTEKVTFTNTLRETELEVKKKWIDAEPKTSHPPIQFTVEATIEGANGEPERYKVDQLRDTADPNKNKVFTLNTENGSDEAVYYIKQLPVVTSGEHEGKQITYTVSEVTVDDYTTTYETKETLQDIEVMKLWADSNHTQETIKVKLQRTSDGKYYSGCVNGTATFADNVEFTELTQDSVGNYSARFSGLPRSDTYRVVQDVDQNQNTTGLVMYRRNVVNHEITNKEDNRKITVIKKWLNADGSEMQTAPQDQISYTVYQSYHEHKWGEWMDKPGHEATETEDGLEIRVCEYDSSHIQERVKAATGHIHNWETTVHPPTCTEQGYTHYHCTKDSTHDYDDDFVPPTGHNYTGVETTPATCETDGLMTYTCHNHKPDGTECGDSYTVPIPATGHNWSDWTPSADGKKESRTCSICHKTETRDKSPYTEQLPFAPDLPYAPEENLGEILPTPDNPNDPNAHVDIKPTGIFKIGDKYYLVFASRDNESWNQVWDSNSNQYNISNLINFGLATEITQYTPIYDEYSFTQGDGYQSYNQRRTDLRKGTLYHAVDGSWYVYIDNASDGMAPPNERWKKLDTGSTTVTTTEGDGGNSTNNPTNFSSGLPKMMARKSGSLDRFLAAGNTDPDSKETRGEPGASSEFDLPDDIKSLEITYPQVVDSGKRTDGHGNFLIMYGSYDLKQSEHADWTMQIKVSNPEDEWTNYRYYVVETDPSTGYTTTYVYEDKNTTGEGYTVVSSEGGIKEEGRVTIKNQKEPEKGALQITKAVTVNDNPPTDANKAKTNGTYVFTVAGITGTPTEGAQHTIQITFTDGKATSYKIDQDEAQTVSGTDNTWSVVLGNLVAGDYTITESEPDNNTVLKTVTGGKSITNKVATVTVTAGDTTPAQAQAKVTFTNNYTEYEVIIVKVDTGNTQYRLGGAVFDLYAESSVENGVVKDGERPLQNNLVSSSTDDENKGKVSLGMLTPGTYYLFETSAPAGYIALDMPVTIHVSDGRVSLTQGSRQQTGTITNDKTELMVMNSSGAELPMTGSTGTKWIYIFGTLITLIAAVGLYLNRVKD